MESHKEFFSWASNQGVIWNGIDFQDIPGCGTGVIATRTLKKGETILTVPFHLYRTLDTLSPRVSQTLSRRLSLWSRLATDLSIDESPGFKKWLDLFPSFQSFRATYPFFWPSDLQDLLPGQAKELLKAQQRRYRNEWAQVTRSFPKIRESQFQYFWMVVTSRSFYLLTRSMETLDPMDCLTLMPVADLFNHSDDGLETVIEDELYRYNADREYSKGEEITLCYAEESNDYLFAEYGFVPSKNKWDKVCIDEVVLPILTEEQKSTLKKWDFFGNYTIDAKTSGCWRTQVALRLTCCGRSNWEQFVRGSHDGALSQPDVDKLLLSLLNRFHTSVVDILKKSKKLNVDSEGRRELLNRRWEQVRAVVVGAMAALRSKSK